MNLANKDDFLKRSHATLEAIYDILGKLKVLQIKELKGDQTALVIVDMVNGFARKGALSSPRVEAVIPDIAELSEKCDVSGIIKLAFGDCHTDASPEFDSYPAHCMTGTEEAEIVDEIKEAGKYTFIAKNSTNGFHEEAFRQWLVDHDHINTFIITGDCTDICIQQFAVSLKTWFNRRNQKARIIIPVNAVETYDLGTHNGDLMNVMALYSMLGNGIELVSAIK